MNTSNPSFFRSIANMLRRSPWLVAPLYSIVRFTRPKYSLGAVGVIFNEHHQVLLVEHVFHPKTHGAYRGAG